MRSLTVLVLFISTTLSSRAQNVNLLYKYGIKAYMQGTFSPEVDANINFPISPALAGTSISTTRYVRPTLAFQIRNIKRNYHEFELNDLSIGKSDDVTYKTLLNDKIIVAGYTRTTTSVAIRYEYIHVFMKNKRHKLVPSLGIAGSPYYIRYQLQPYTTNQYPVSNTYIGAKIFLIPRINYFLNRNIFFDFNIPLCIADMHHAMYKELNPTVPQSISNFSLTNFNAFPNYFSLRAGIGIKL